MTRKLAPMVICNPRRRGLGYRLRDATLVSATRALWIMLASQTYLTLTDRAFASQQAVLLSAGKWLLMAFVGIFLVLHAWVVIECLRARRQHQTASPDERQARRGARLAWLRQLGSRVSYHQPIYRTSFLVAIIFLTDIFT